MHRLRGSRWNRWRRRKQQQQRQQGSDGRLRARSIIPALVLVTCMVAVLYGNVTLYAKKETRPSVLLDQKEASGTAEAAAEVTSERKSEAEPSAEAIGGLNSKAAIPKEEDLPAVRGDREDEVDGRWDDDSVREEGSKTLKGWKDVEKEKEETGSEREEDQGVPGILGGGGEIEGENRRGEDKIGAAASSTTLKGDGGGNDAGNEGNSEDQARDDEAGAPVESSTPTGVAEGKQELDKENPAGISVSRDDDEEFVVAAKKSATEAFLGDKGGGTEEGVILGGDGGGGSMVEHGDGAVEAAADQVQGLANQVPVDGKPEEAEGEGENEGDRAGDSPTAGSAADGSSVKANPSEGGAAAAAGIAVEGDKQAEGRIVDVGGGAGTGAGEGSEADAARPVDGDSGSGKGLERQGDGAIADEGMLENRPGGEGGPVFDVAAGGGDGNTVNEQERPEAAEVGAEGKAAGEGGDENLEGDSVIKGDGDKENVKGEGEGGQQAPEVKGENQAEALRLPTTGFIELGGVVEVSDAKGEDDKDLPPNGAVKGAMECSMINQGEGAENIPNIATWKVVPGDADYRGPLLREAAASNSTRYVTLEKDLGAFNNIRMSLECAVAFAAATGRTFVIPPPFPVWNMNTGIRQKEVDLRTLFTFDKLRESGRVDVITTEEFLEKEALSGKLGVSPWEEVKRLQQKAVSQYLEKVGGMYEKGLPELRVERAAFVMPRRMDERVDIQSPSYELAKRWLYGRTELEYFDLWPEAKVVHWRAHEARLLAPFYAFVMHADEAADRYYKRLMRDLVHYPEEVYCKASQVIALIMQEDPSGTFSSFHVRRNDFVGFYKAVSIEPDKIVESSADHLREHEVLYIATDEKNKEFFKPFRERYRVRFLSDYYERAAVAEMNPNYIGMLEQIIASHGRTFTGCWFSTFTAYILRLRGHLKKPRVSNWSYYPPKKKYHRAYNMPENPLWASEWPFGWEDIDATGVPDPMVP